MDAEKLAMQRRIDTLDQHATRLHAALIEYERENARLKAKLETVKRERDALLHDIRYIIRTDFFDNECNVCNQMCKQDKRCKEADWRGLCEENGGITDD